MQNNAEWKESVFLAVINKETRPDTISLTTEFEASFDYVIVNFLNEKERDGLVRFWRDKEVAQLTALMAEKAASPTELMPLLEKVREISAAQEKAIKKLRGKMPLDILTRGISTTTKEMGQAIEFAQEKIKQLIYTDNKTFAASNLDWEKHIKEKTRGCYFGGRSHYSVSGLTILDVYDYVKMDRTYKMTPKQREELPPKSALRAALDDYLKDPAIRSFSSAHLSEWDAAIHEAFNELRYYRSDDYLNDLKEKNWKEAFYVKVLGGCIPPSRNIKTSDIETAVDTVLKRLPRLELHILLSNFRDRMSSEAIAKELFLTANKVDKLLEKAWRTLTPFEVFFRDLIYLDQKEILEKSEANETYLSILTELRKDHSPENGECLSNNIYAWAFMRDRSALADPNVPLDFEDSCNYILNGLSSAEKSFVNAFFIERKSLPQIAADLQKPLDEIIQIRSAFLQKIRAPENHAMLAYGKTYINALPEGERNDLIAGFLPIESIRSYAGLSSFFSLRYTACIQTVKELFDKEMAVATCFLSPESHTVQCLERFLNIPSFNDVEAQSAKYAYRMRIQKAIREKYYPTDGENHVKNF